MRNAVFAWFVPMAALLLSVALTGCGKGELTPRDAAPQCEESAPPSGYVSGIFNAGGGVPVEHDPKPETPEDPSFRFPDDHAGTLLAKVLPPSEPPRVVERTTQPRPHPGAQRVEAPGLPLSSHTELPHVAIASKQAPQPHLVMEEVFFITHAETLLPAAVALEAAARVRVPSVDVNQPIPLPILAKPASDRAPLDDATIEASNAAALSGTVPARTKPAPFLKLTLPDPFENRKPVAPPVTQMEDVPNTTPRLPKP
jgi:hypothetical protein